MLNRLGYCFTPYQRLLLYNDAPLVAFYDTLGIRRTYSRLKPPASSRGSKCEMIGAYWYGDLIKQYEVSLSQMLNDILWPDHIQWQPLLIRLCTELDLYQILSGFHRTFATGVACRQGTLTPPDTWSRPFWDLHIFYLLRPLFLPNLSLVFRTMLFEYPSVLSRFCFCLVCLIFCLLSL